ncbi:MAG: hypothetical protein R2882_03110 [Gemmatimonadales bacterium]
MIDVERVARGYARGLAVLGPILVVAMAVLDPRWISHPGVLGVFVVAILILRSAPVRLSKFSYLTQTGVAALVGAVAVPASTTSIGLFFGVVVTDWLVLRKTPLAVLVNAGREVVSFAAAYGFYAAALEVGGIVALRLEFLPAAAVLIGAYFIVGRLLFYFSLLIRDKLSVEDRSFLLRWEVVTYLVTVLAIAWSSGP